MLWFRVMFGAFQAAIASAIAQGVRAYDAARLHIEGIATVGAGTQKVDTCQERMEACTRPPIWASHRLNVFSLSFAVFPVLADRSSRG